MKMKEFKIPDNPYIFFSWLKKMSEKAWANAEIVEGVFGFQTQSGTKWAKGLTEDEIADYENELKFTFPEIYKLYLRNLNGTDKPAINVYGNSGTRAEAPNYYSFPRDLEAVKDRIRWIYEEFLVDEEEVNREKIPHIIPIVGHRFLIADNCAENPVLSIYGRDAILYASNLKSLLVADIFKDYSCMSKDLTYPIKFWLDDDPSDLTN